MQYDLDTHSEQAELFLYLRAIILTFETINEVKNAKQTTYKDRYSAVCMLRVRKGVVRLSFGNGTKMQTMFSELLGEAKFVRYLEFEAIENVQKERIEAMVQESQLINMEKYELQKLRCNAIKASR